MGGRYRIRPTVWTLERPVGRTPIALYAVGAHAMRGRGASGKSSGAESTSTMISLKRSLTNISTQAGPWQKRAW